ncbi:hypothetical protein E0493_04290 [Roseomonas sp. M0104]|uniref:Uncharacterized protein n=1 Tax=Teichococcus coralli TaxID=2545983 RepID=A0A845BB27_9PROT|nr:hypothetical protein [Pseudoroseomonas coralli]MXP62572.1 hypothetical protein [Pseudoroseomonas coralli]
MPNKLTERRSRIDLRSWLILGVGLGAAAFLVLAMGGLYALYRWTQAPMTYEPPRQFPQPRLEANPAASLATFRAAQRAELEGGPQPDGTLRLSIEQAMETIARRGAQAYAPLQAPPAAPLPVRPEAVR